MDSAAPHRRRSWTGSFPAYDRSHHPDPLSPTGSESVPLLLLSPGVSRSGPIFLNPHRSAAPVFRLLPVPTPTPKIRYSFLHLAYCLSLRSLYYLLRRTPHWYEAICMPHLSGSLWPHFSKQYLSSLRAPYFFIFRAIFLVVQCFVLFASCSPS